MVVFRAGKILCNDSLADWEKGIITPFREVSSQQRKDKKRTVVK